MRCCFCGIGKNIYKEKFVNRQGKIYCPACIRFLKRKRLTQEEYREQIKNIFDSIAIKNNSGYKVIVLFSGGKDSVVALYLAKIVYKLKVLAVTLQNGFLSEEAQRNIQKVTSFLKVEHLFVFDNNWRRSIISCIKNKDIPCGKLCTGYKLANIKKLHKQFPCVKIFITGDELPFVMKNSYSAVKKMNGLSLVRILCGWIKKEKDVFKIIKNLPWKKYNLYGYTSDCLAVGYALEQFNKLHDYKFEEIYLSDRVRHGLIAKETFLSLIKRKKKNNPRHQFLVQQIIDHP